MSDHVGTHPERVANMDAWQLQQVAGRLDPRAVPVPTAAFGELLIEARAAVFAVGDHVGHACDGSGNPGTGRDGEAGWNSGCGHG